VVLIAEFYLLEVKHVGKMNVDRIVHAIIKQLKNTE